MNGIGSQARRLPKPMTTFFTLLLIVFGIETLIMYLLPLVLPTANIHLQDFADSFSLSVLSAPFIWVLVARPLRAAAVDEITRTKATLEHIVDAVINFNDHGTIESLNPAAGKMFGYVPSEIVGQHITHIIPGMEAAGGVSPRAGHSPAPGVGFRVDTETTGRHNDGTCLPVEISISKLQLGGRSTFTVIIHDVSERKRAEAALQEQKDFSLKLVQDSAVPSFVLAPDHTVLVWNKACEELTGLKAGDLVGTDEQWKAFYDHERPTLADLVIDGRGQEIAGLYNEFARSPFTEDGLQSEGWYPNLGGKRRYLFFDAVPVRNARGELLAVIETLEEITERKSAEESLRISEEKFFKAFHASPDGIVINSKADGYFMEGNDAFFRMLGYSREEIIGHSSLELGLWVDPSERKKIIERTEREGAVRNVEVKIRIKSGEVRTLLWSSDVLILNNVECLIVTLRDITIQKENERNLLKSKAELVVQHEQLSALFGQIETVKKEWERTLDRINDVVILLDREGRVRRCNRAATQFFGIPHEDLPGREWEQLVQLPEMPPIPPVGYDWELYHEKLNRWFSFTRYPYSENGDEGESGTVITIHDTTETIMAAMEIEKAYTELKEAQAQLIQQEKMASIGQLAAGVAHEINNPTGFIMSNLGTLQKYFERLSNFARAQTEMITAHGMPDENEKLADLQKQLKIERIVGDLPGLISESQDGAERIKKIAQDLKSFSRADEADCKMASLIDCIESTISIVWNELKYKATLRKEFGELPLIKCYPHQLSQVFMNLLVNAAHAIDKQGEIIVRTWQEENSACISVADTGSGIPEAIRSRIFEPFFTTKEAGKGTGLGLSISYDIIKKHGGDISVESTVGSGTTFTVRLPLNAMQTS